MTAGGFVLLAACIIGTAIAARWLFLAAWDLVRHIRRRPWWRA